LKRYILDLTCLGRYVFIDKTRYGPYTKEEVISFIGDGKVTGDTYVFSNDIGMWKKAREVFPGNFEPGA